MTAETTELLFSEIRQVLIVVVPALLTGLFVYLAGSKTSKAQVQIAKENNIFNSKLKLLDHLKGEIEKSDSAIGNLNAQFEKLLGNYITYLGYRLGNGHAGSEDDPEIQSLVETFEEASTVFVDELNYTISFMRLYKESVIVDLGDKSEFLQWREEIDQIDFVKVESYDLGFPELERITYDLKEKLLRIHYASHLHFQSLLKEAFSDVCGNSKG